MISTIEDYPRSVKFATCQINLNQGEFSVSSGSISEHDKVRTNVSEEGYNLKTNASLMI